MRYGGRGGRSGRKLSALRRRLRLRLLRRRGLPESTRLSMDVHLHRSEDIEDIDTDSDRRYNLVRTYIFLDIYPWTYMTALTTTLPIYLIRLDKHYCVRYVLTVTGTSVFIAQA